VQRNDTFYWTARARIADTTPGTSANLAAMQVPLGVAVECLMAAGIRHSAAVYVVFTGPDETDTAASSSHYDLYTEGHDLGQSGASQINLSRFTDTSSQIRYRSTVGTVTAFDIFTLGWIDPRGRNA